MNIQERDKILEQIESVQELNITELIAEYYGKEEDISAISIGGMPVEVFICYFNNSLEYLKKELLTDNFYIYSNQSPAQPIASINITNVLTSLKANLDKKEIPQIPGLIMHLVTYANYYGFWHLATHKSHSIGEKELKKKSSELELLENKLKEDLKTVQEEISHLNKEKKALAEFVAKKQAAIEQITNNLNATTGDANQVSQLLATTKQVAAQVEAILVDQKKKLDEIKAELISEKNKFKDFETINTDLQKQLEGLHQEITEGLAKAIKHIDFIAGKKDEIVKLTGMAADGSLGSKFETRQDTLQKSVDFWKWTVPIATAISVIWVIAVFVWMKAEVGNAWVNIGINLLKTTPAFVLMGWVLKQYSKERNLQEEYAFKSAVAMTITAYSDLLAENDNEGNKSRQKMILDAIQEVHSSPKIHDEKSKDVSKNGLSGTIDSVKQIKDLVKEIKS
jgi:hypothetical protein